MSTKTRLESISESYLTQDELRRLFGAITLPSHRLLFLLAYRHGLRASEIGLLRIGNVDFEANRLIVRRVKGSLPGLHSIEPDELRMLRAHVKILPWKEPAAPLFPAGRTQRSLPVSGISRRRLDQLMKQYAEKAALPEHKRHFHCLKHSIATHLLEAGQDIVWVQDWLGHADINNTLVYARLTNRARDEGARIAFARLPRF